MTSQIRAAATTAGILKDVHRRVNFLHRIACNREALHVIDESLKLLWEDEKRLRESTVTIGLTSEIEHQQVVDTIGPHWLDSMNKRGIVFWRDYYNTYCEFSTVQEKNDFLDSVKAGTNFDSIKELIKEPTSDGYHFQRRPVKLIFVGVDSRIRADKIRETLNKVAPQGSSFGEMRTGKMYGARQVRSISFTANARGFEYLFKTLRGRVPYSDSSRKISTKLNTKINIKPYMCNNCSTIGRHDCKGKTCSRCSAQNHTARDCESTVEFCINCKKPTHKSSDCACPTFLNLLVREIRKFDIPIEFLADKDARLRLISALSLN